MTKATVTKFFAGGLVAVFAGLFIAVVAGVGRVASGEFVMDRADVTGVQFSPFGDAYGRARSIAGGFAIGIASSVAGLVAYLGALISTHCPRIDDKAWFVLLLVLGLLKLPSASSPWSRTSSRDRTARCPARLPGQSPGDGATATETTEGRASYGPRQSNRSRVAWVAASAGWPTTAYCLLNFDDLGGVRRRPRSARAASTRRGRRSTACPAPLDSGLAAVPPRDGWSLGLGDELAAHHPRHDHRGIGGVEPPGLPAASSPDRSVEPVHEEVRLAPPNGGASIRSIREASPDDRLWSLPIAPPRTRSPPRDGRGRNRTGRSRRPGP